MSTEKYTEEQVIEAIRGTGGIKTQVAKRLGCHRHTVTNYIERYESVAQAYEDEEAGLLDEAEHQLKLAVEEGEPWAIKFLLARKGGWSLRQEITGPAGGPQEYKVTSVQEREPEKDAEYIASVLANIDAIPGRSNGNVAQNTEEPIRTTQADAETNGVSGAADG